MRVYEVAKLLGISSKEALALLAKSKLGPYVNHMAVLSDQAIGYLESCVKPATASNSLAASTEAINIEQKDQPAKATGKQELMSQASTNYKNNKAAQFSGLKSNFSEAGSRGGREKAVVKITSPKELVLGKEKPLFVVAEEVGKNSGELITAFLKKGKLYNRNQVLTHEEMLWLVGELNIPFREVEVQATTDTRRHEAPSGLGEARKPVVVVMGHVDHGKTTLLDYIRKTNVAAKEKGGITQHLGAYEVNCSQGSVVFLDTPGHEAFTQMRRYGAMVTDLVVLIVAADDGVKPQTLEALECAKSAQVPIIVAVNKIDKVADSVAALDKIKRQLAEQGLIPEDWGGSTIYVPISAKTGFGVDDLLEMIILQAQILELQAFPSMPLQAYILESRLEKGLGPVATAIVMRGLLKKGAYIATPSASGKVRFLETGKGARVDQVGASTPVRIVGFDRLPAAGEWIESISSEQFTRGLRQESSAFKLALQTASLEKKQTILNFIVKADTYGSLQALTQGLEKIEKQISEDSVGIRILGKAVGPVGESDVLRAIDNQAIILVLHAPIDKAASILARDHNVNIVHSSIIYHLLDDCEKLIEQSKKPEIILKKIGEAVVRKVFNIKGQGVIAGSYLTSGSFVRNAKVLCFRDGKEIGAGPITSLQRDKKTIKEVLAGHEFAFICSGFQEWEVDDIVHCLVQETVTK